VGAVEGERVSADFPVNRESTGKIPKSIQLLAAQSAPESPVRWVLSNTPCYPEQGIQYAVSGKAWPRIRDLSPPQRTARVG